MIPTKYIGRGCVYRWVGGWLGRSSRGSRVARWGRFVGKRRLDKRDAASEMQLLSHRGLPQPKANQTEAHPPRGWSCTDRLPRLQQTRRV